MLPFNNRIVAAYPSVLQMRRNGITMTLPEPTWTISSTSFVREVL